MVESLFSTWYLIPLTILAGFLAGIINTLAGSGSAVTLAMLSLLGLPSTIANGTNRIGVLFQSFIGFTTYRKNANIDLTNRKSLVVSCVLGSIVGSQIAVEIDEFYLNLLLAITMVFLLGAVLFNSKKWLVNHTDEQKKMSKIIGLPLFFLIGIYGGFLQAGVGILLLSSLILGQGLNLKQANGIKLLIVLLYIVPSLFIFFLNDQLIWKIGFLLAIGQVAGAYLAATFATQFPNANFYIHKLLICILIFSILRFGSLAYGAL